MIIITINVITRSIIIIITIAFLNVKNPNKSNQPLLPTFMIKATRATYAINIFLTAGGQVKVDDERQLIYLDINVR